MLTLTGIRVCYGLVRLHVPLAITVLYPSGYTRGTTSIVFEENQLSPDLISLSPQSQLIRCFFNNSRFGPPVGVTHLHPGP